MNWNESITHAALMSLLTGIGAIPALADQNELVALEESVIKTEEISYEEKPFIAQESRAASFWPSLLETPRSVSVVTEQQIEDMGMQSVQDAFLYMSGVYGATYGYDTRGDWALIRGASPTYYVDGLRYNYGNYNNTRPAIETLESVEVLKGPASILYGQSTTGGIINMNSKLPLASPRREVEVQVGNFNRRQVSGDFSGKLSDNGHWLYRVSALYRDSDTQVDFVENNALSIMPSLSWKPKEGTTLSFLLNFQKNESGTGAVFYPHTGTVLPGPRIPANTFLSVPGWDRYDTDQVAGTFFVDHVINETFSFQGRARYTDSSSDYNSAWADIGTEPTAAGNIARDFYSAPADTDAFVADARVKAGFDTGALTHEMVGGIDYQDASYSSKSYFGNNVDIINVYNPNYGNPPTVVYGAVSTTNFEQHGVYLNDLIRLNSWILSLGGRYDETSSQTTGGSAQDDDAFTSQVSLMYEFENGVAPYATYAESFLPQIGTNGRGSLLKPLEGVLYEAGVKYQPKGTQSLLTAAVFDIAEENRTVPSVTGIGTDQLGELSIKGLELEAQSQWRDFFVKASYTYLSTEDVEGDNIAATPGQMASAWVSHRPNSGRLEGFRWGAGVRYVGKSWDGTDTISTPAYTLFDGMVGYAYEAWDFALNGRNLTDKYYVASAGSRGDSFIGESRTIVFSARYSF